MKWYLVKVNWARTEEVLPGFAGLGGEVWPLDSLQTVEAKAAHWEMEEARAAVALECSTEMLCQDWKIATRYARACASLMPGRTQLVLEVGLAAKDTEDWDGFDVGSASGGYSLIESEILHGGREGLLNSAGLFGSVADARSYLSRRVEEGLEDAGSLELLGIRVVRPDSQD